MGIVRTIVTAVVGVIVVGILLVVLEADRGNDIVEAFLDVARFLVAPFRGIFDLDSAKGTVVINWGLAAMVYGAIGALIARVAAR